MSNKPNILIAGFRLKCPNCGKGHLFVNPNAYNYKTMSVMHDRCSNCRVSFNTWEPGFYWGAMFVSYFLSAGLVFFNLLWIHFFFGWNLWGLILPNVILIILLAPLNFRVSRALWLGINMRIIDKGQ